MQFQDCAGKACLDMDSLRNYINNRDANEEWMTITWTLCKPKPEEEELNNDDADTTN